MKHDCGFVQGRNWFRYRAAAIILEEGCVLFAKNERDDYYYSIGGAVHLGERAEDAVRREVFEETGVHYEVDRLAFIHENFFRGTGSLEGYDCHAVEFYFLMKSKGSQMVQPFNKEGHFMEYMHWLPLEQVTDFHAYPRFLIERLDNLPTTLEHIVSADPTSIAL
ncbi:MAG: NUDIX hydrolase [Erysipelotrichaceae bacterium]